MNPLSFMKGSPVTCVGSTLSTPVSCVLIKPGHMECIINSTDLECSLPASMLPMLWMGCRPALRVAHNLLGLKGSRNTFVEVVFFGQTLVVPRRRGQSATPWRR